MELRGLFYSPSKTEETVSMIHIQGLTRNQRSCHVITNTNTTILLQFHCRSTCSSMVIQCYSAALVLPCVRPVRCRAAMPMRGSVPSMRTPASAIAHQPQSCTDIFRSPGCLPNPRTYQSVSLCSAHVCPLGLSVGHARNSAHARKTKSWPWLCGAPATLTRSSALVMHPLHAAQSTWLCARAV